MIRIITAMYLMVLSGTLPAHADICMRPIVMTCTLAACYNCETAADGVKYCSAGACKNNCTPDPGLYQCTREDGSTYTKPLFETEKVISK